VGETWDGVESGNKSRNLEVKVRSIHVHQELNDFEKLNRHKKEKKRGGRKRN